MIATIRDEYKAKNLEMDLITHIQLYLKEAIILLAYGNYKNVKSHFRCTCIFKNIKCIIKQMNFIAFYLTKKSLQLIKNSIYIT